MHFTVVLNNGRVETLRLPMLYVKVAYLIEDLDEMLTTSKYFCEVYNREHSMRKKVFFLKLKALNHQ